MVGLDNIKDKPTTEEKALGLAGAGHDTDTMVDEFYARKHRVKTKKTLCSSKPKRIPTIKDALAIEDRSLLMVRTFGFKDGVLQHNMPCPVCVKYPAKYSSKGFFAPCQTCENNGYILKKKIFS